MEEWFKFKLPSILTTPYCFARALAIALRTFIGNFNFLLRFLLLRVWMAGPYNFPPVCIPATFINLSQFHSLNERLKGTTQRKERNFRKKGIRTLVG